MFEFDDRAIEKTRKDTKLDPRGEKRLILVNQRTRECDRKQKDRRGRIRDENVSLATDSPCLSRDILHRQGYHQNERTMEKNEIAGEDGDVYFCGKG